jgi:hypothetical protein
MAMVMDYNKFKESVPKDTLEFVNKMLPMIQVYVERKAGIKIKDEITSYDYEKMLTIMLHLYSELNDIEKSFLAFHNYDKKRAQISSDTSLQIKPEELNDFRNDIFNKYIKYFCFYDDSTSYQLLTPGRILENAFKELNNSSNSRYSSVRHLFESYDKLIDYNKSLISDVAKKIAIEKQKLETELYGEMPINSISYLETVSKVHTLLLSRRNNNSYNKQLLTTNPVDIYLLSRLIAIYYYNDIEQTNGSISEKDAMIEMFNSKGINLDFIYKQLGFSISKSDVTNTERNALVLKQSYEKYIKEGLNVGKKDSEITPANMVSNIFDRSFNDTLILEKILAVANAHVGMFDNFSEQVPKIIEEQNNLRVLKSINDFYENLPNQTREFMDFVAKTYQIVIKKMKIDGYNTELLFTEEEADTIALFIGTYYFDNDISKFFKDNGVTLEKVLKLLNFTITKKEIDEAQLNEQVLVTKYRQFVYEGVNKGKKSTAIGINNIARNLCSSSFNQSTIMIDIFDKLSNGETIESDFLNQLERYLEQKEKDRKRDLTQKLFKDMPANTMEYLENVSRIHQFLVNSGKNLSKKDLKTLSLLLGIHFSSDNDMKKFFSGIKLTSGKILEYLEISNRNNSALTQNSIDIDILANEYGELIFGGHNKDKIREDLTITSIIKNIFNREINNSVVIIKMLGSLGLTYEELEDLEKLYQTYLEKNELAEKEELKQKLLNRYNTPTRIYFENVVKIHIRILNSYETCNRDIIKDINDVEELSMVLGLFISNNDFIKYFKKNGLSLEKILEYCKIDESILTDLESDNLNNDVLLVHYKKYFAYDDYGNDLSFRIPVKRIFNQSLNKSYVVEELTAHCGYVYDILKEEVENEREHVVVLSDEDRLALVATEPISELDVTSTKSILQYGNVLSPHLEFIHNGFNELVLNDSHEKAIKTIQDMIDDMYKKPVIEEKSKGFLSWLLGKPAVLVSEEPTFELTGRAIESLRYSIDANIETLSKELLGYDFIRQYIEEYRKKNRIYYLKSKEAVEDLKKQLETLSPEDDEMFSDYLAVSGRLRIMADKETRFGNSNFLMKQELVKVNQTMINHFITINALEMARDDLIPLIGSELAIAKGIESENKSLDLSSNVMDLFKSLLTRNVEGTVNNVIKLRQTALDPETFDLINQDISIYLDSLNKAPTLLEGKVEDFDIDSGYSTLIPASPSPIKLELKTSRDVENNEKKKTI